MEMRTCGKSGIEISTMGIGCWSYGGGDYWGPQAQSDVTAVANAALDAGINFFDTAEGYNEGRSEEALAVALNGQKARSSHRHKGKQTRSCYDTGTLRSESQSVANRSC